MTRRNAVAAATALAAALALAACEGGLATTYDPATDPDLAGAEPGSIVYSDTPKPGWLYEEDAADYYYIVPPRR